MLVFNKHSITGRFQILPLNAACAELSKSFSTDVSGIPVV
jgi:hypothetical protein